MEEPFKHGFGIHATFIEGGAALVILFAVLETAATAVSAFTHRRDEEILRDLLRIRPGQWLAVALEFELAAIIVLRTVLNFFLQREIEHARRREEQGHDLSPDRKG